MPKTGLPQSGNTGQLMRLLFSWKCCDVVTSQKVFKNYFFSQRGYNDKMTKISFEVYTEPQVEDKVLITYWSHPALPVS